jgi:hypothetical protein
MSDLNIAELRREVEVARINTDPDEPDDYAGTYARDMTAALDEIERLQATINTAAAMVRYSDPALADALERRLANSKDARSHDRA